VKLNELVGIRLRGSSSRSKPMGASNRPNARDHLLAVWGVQLTSRLSISVDDTPSSSAVVSCANRYASPTGLNRLRPIGGGGVGLNDGEGGSGKTDGYIGTCSGIAIAGDAGNGAGTATERARSALPVIWPQKHGPSFGAPVWPGCDSCKA